MRIIFYLLSGICATLIGWNLSQLVILDFPLLFGAKSLPFYPDFILLPLVAICLNTAMVTTEIYLSHPTKLKANWRNLKPYLKNTILFGLGIGLGTAILTSLLYQTGINAGFIRVIAWSLIGCLIGLSEGLSWRSRSIEGSTDKGKSRVWKSPLFGFIAGLIAAIIIELIRQPIKLRGFEDPVGFVILGLSLGLLLSFAAAPTYQVALRAGAGFEATKSVNNNPPKLKNRDGQTFERLRFVTEDQTWETIEEGLSIQLPAKISNQQPLIIGSSNDAHIYLPNIPEQVAQLITEDGKLKLRCLVDQSVKIQNETLSARGKARELLHNQILTFFYQDNTKKYYRFIFYDRFLDPEA
jgi:hypothetical protein